MLEAIKYFDAFPKALDEFRLKTNVGGMGKSSRILFTFYILIYFIFSFHHFNNYYDFNIFF